MLVLFDAATSVNQFVAGRNHAYLQTILPPSTYTWQDFTTFSGTYNTGSTVITSNTLTLTSTYDTLVPASYSIGRQVRTSSLISIPSDSSLYITLNATATPTLSQMQLVLWCGIRATYSGSLPVTQVYPTLGGAHDGSLIDTFGIIDTVTNTSQSNGLFFAAGYAPALLQTGLHTYKIDLASLTGLMLYVRIGVAVYGNATRSLTADIKRVTIEPNLKHINLV